ncbi:MAG TPA: hypothetical protein ENK17_02530 [Anaerolineae bacterium]|nr:hypothetical protein [Anaerolineae bacterium]
MSNDLLEGDLRVRVHIPLPTLSALICAIEWAHEHNADFLAGRDEVGFYIDFVVPDALEGVPMDELAMRITTWKSTTKQE